jgi:dienelactone hydrolase
MKKMTTFLLVTVVTLAQAQKNELKIVAYTDGSQKLNGMAIGPENGKSTKPGVLILPAWYGIQAHEKDVAQQLSAMGYYVFIADIFGEGNYPESNEDAGKQAGYYKKNYKDYQRRIALALEQLFKSGAHKDNVAIIGYCFGGTGVLEAARAGLPVKGVVSFHGGLGKDASRPNNTLAAKVLVCHGAIDPMVSKAEIDTFQKEMTDSKADWQMVYYADAVHGFTEPKAGSDISKGVAYNEKADKRSWQHMKDFFAEVLK